MRTRIVSVVVGAAICLVASGSPLGASESGRPAVAVPQPSVAETAASDAHRAVLDRYCVACHNERTLTAGLALDSADLADVGAHAELWEGVVRKLRAGLMPPCFDCGRHRGSARDAEGKRVASQPRTGSG